MVDVLSVNDRIERLERRQIELYELVPELIPELEGRIEKLEVQMKDRTDVMDTQCQRIDGLESYIIDLDKRIDKLKAKPPPTYQHTNRSTDCVLTIAEIAELGRIFYRLQAGDEDAGEES